MDTHYILNYFKMNISNFRLMALTFGALFFHNFLMAQCNPDVNPPVIVCNAFVQVSLDGNGLATLGVDAFEEGMTTDDCCLDGVTIRRMNETCAGYESDLDFGDEITFCCEDTDADFEIVVLRATDCSGNFNECWTEVDVQDKLPPILVSCPAATTATCQFYDEHIAQFPADNLDAALDAAFGMAEFQDNCFLNIESEVTINQPNVCENFFIERTWSANDGASNSSQTYSGSGFAVVASNAVGQQGDEVCIDVSVYGFEDILSMQFSMNFDETVLNFDAVTGLNLQDLTAGNFGLTDTSNGDITLSWFDNTNASGVTVPDETVIFQVCFNVIGSAGSESDFTFSPNPTVWEVVDGSGNELTINTLNGNISAGNPGNGTVNCAQTIEIIFDNVWDVEFPADVTLTCFDAGDFDAGEPEVLNPSCALTASAWEDIILPGATPDLCLKILRTWTVINWCDASVQTHTQIIKISNSGALNLTCPENIVAFSDPNNQFATVTLPLPEAGDCAVMPTFTATSDLPSFNPITFSATNVPEGEYSVTFTGTDQCGNNESCTTSITVQPLEDDCPADATIDCDFYETELAATLEDLEGNSAAQSEFLNQYFGEPTFDAGQNIVTDVQVNLDQCGEGTITRTWSLGIPPPPTDGFTIIASNEIGSGQLCVSISVADFIDILSMQFSIHFDPSVLEFSSVGGFSLDGLTSNNFGTTDVENGNLTIAWFDPSVQGITLENGEEIFDICFNLIGEGGTSSAISFDGNPTSIEIIDVDGNLLDFNSITGSVLVEPCDGSNTDCVVFSVSNNFAQQGDQICVDYSVQNFDNILSFQYSMHFDETVLEFAGTNLFLQDLTNGNFGTSDNANGNLTMSWFDNTFVAGVTVPDCTVIYQLCFDVIGEIGDVSPMTIDGSPTIMEVTDGDGNPVCFETNSGVVLITENSPENSTVTTTSAGQILCTQTITVNHVSDFVVEFPADVTVECTGNTLDTEMPEIFNETCELIATSYEDVVFTDVPNACYKIERKFTVINWCVVGAEIENEVEEVPESQLVAPNNDLDGDGDSDDRTFRDSWNGIHFPDASNAGTDGEPDTDLDENPWDGYITYTQNIWVNDNVAPAFANNCETTTVCLDSPFTCSGAITIPEPEVLDCSPQITLSLVSDLGEGFGPFENVAPGIYVATLTATDICGNSSTCQTSFEVLDCAVPIAICEQTTMVSLSAGGTAIIFAENLDDGSYDSCSEVSFAFANGNNIVFTCDDEGSNFVELIVTDANGNSNSCFTEVVVVDNLDVCPNDPCDDLPQNAIACNDQIIIELLNSNPPMVDLWVQDVVEGIPADCFDNFNFSFDSNSEVPQLVFNCDDLQENYVVVTDLNTGNSCWGTIIIQDNFGVCGGVDPGDCNNDVVNPTPYCLNGLVTELTNINPPFVQIFASDFDAGSFDNCSDDLSFSFSPDVMENSIVFDCENVGTQAITMWVTDEAGNQDFCETFIVIQDNIGLCSGNPDCQNDEEAPVVFCANGLVISIPTSGELTLNASTFDIGSLDNCTDQEDLELSIELVDNDGNTIIPVSESITFNLGNIGANNIILYVEDEAGNISECSTIFFLQSNPPKFITGKIFIDENNDCLYDAGEQGLDSWSVKLELIDDPNATEPGIVLLPNSFDIDADGNYNLTLPDNFEFFTPDSSVVTVNNLNAYLRLSLATTFNYGQSCPYTYTIDAATNVLETVEVDFPVQVIEDCPQLVIDITTPFLRRCFDNNYTVHYCNYGNQDVNGVFIEVEIDEFLLVNGSTHPWSAVNNHVYTFVIGTVSAAECGSFTINTTVSCDAELGQSHCVDARIFPDVICDENGANYLGANLNIIANCEGEEVKFTITNDGDEDMDEEVQYIIIEDFIMYNTTPHTLQLDAGESTNVFVPNNGSTWRLEADPIPGHPIAGKPSATIEGCTQTGEFSTGFLNMFPPSNSSPVISINCMENVGSFDPNDKLAIPIGYGDEHFIETNTDLEYIIRFQNTGTDTAFNIVILDTLSQHLDPASVRPGASSHNYDFTILGDNVLKFNFDNIMLPDSNVNEALSHGYISFKVSQFADVPVETVIENDAAIYFDFNEPIITNEVFHTIGDHFIEMPDNTTVVFVPNVEVLVYPNPFNTEATIKIDGMNISEGVLRTFDVTGKLVKTIKFNQNKFEISAADLPSGMYFYQIFDNEELVANGKFSKN